MSDSHEFESFGAADIAITDLFGLRTFTVDEEGMLSSLVQGTGHWVKGECTAVCTTNVLDPDHVAPVDGCRCGIYATFGIDHLLAQYRANAVKLVAVVQATGASLIGPTGFRTARANVVAFWVRDDAVAEEQACLTHCCDARQWWDRDLMIEIYELEKMIEMFTRGESHG